MSVVPLAVGLLLVRLIVAASAARAARTASATRPPPSRGTGRMLRFALFWLVLAPCCAALAFTEPRGMLTYTPGTLFLVTVLLWPLALQVLAPLGLVRPAYYVGFAAWNASDDRVGAALIAATRALHRKGDFDAEAAAWIEDKIQKQSELRGSTIVAAASLAAARGDRDGARLLFESVQTLDPRATSAAGRRVAIEWRALDAADRGAWQEVVDLGSILLESSRSAWLLAGVGQRLLGEPLAPGRSRLLLRWLFAPGRLHTFAIVERALSVPDGAAPVADDVAEIPLPQAKEGDLLALALALHTRLLRTTKPTASEIARVGRAFDAAFDEDALAAHVTERGAMLGAMRSSEALARFRREVEDSLFQLLKSHEIALDDTVDELGEVAGRAQRRLRDEVLGVIEALSDAVRNRVSERRALSMIDEWREWTALRMAYERGVRLGGPELRYLAFTKVHSDVCAMAVWLFNDRKERPLANAMFRFLLAEATAVGDTEGMALQAKNVACGV